MAVTIPREKSARFDSARVSDQIRWLLDILSRYKMVILLATLVGLGASAVRTFFLIKPAYSSSAYIKVDWNPYRTDARTYETCFLVFDTLKVYGEAVKKLNLRERWGLPLENCASRLESMTRIFLLEDTSILCIRCMARGPEDAKDFTVAVTESYINDRVSYHAKSVTSRNTELEQAYRELKGEAEHYRSLLDQRKLLSARVSLEDSKGLPQSISMLRWLYQKTLTRALASIGAFQVLNSSPPETLMRLDEATASRSPETERRLLSQWSMADAEFKKALDGRTEDHPMVRKWAAMRRKAQELIQREAASVLYRAGIEAEVSGHEAEVMGQEYAKSLETFRQYQKDLLAVGTINHALGTQLLVLRDFQKKFDEAELYKEVPIVLLELISPASEAEPVQDTPFSNILLAGILSFLTACLITIAVETIDLSMEVADRIERELNTTVLGAIPHHIFSRRKSNRSHYAEAYRLLRTHLSFAFTGPSGHVLVVTSSGPKEGKSTTAANLAIVWAQSGKRVVLVDCDLVRPTVHRLFGCERSPGLSEFLSGECQDFSFIRESTYPGLQVVPGGRYSGSTSILLENERFLSFLTRMRATADVVILDSTPVLGFSHVLVMATHCDGILFVVETGRYSMREGREALALLRRTHTPILGVCLNKIDLDRPGRVYHGYYRYYSHYRYYRKYSTPEGDAGDVGLISIKEPSDVRSH